MLIDELRAKAADLIAKIEAMPLDPAAAPPVEAEPVDQEAAAANAANPATPTSAGTAGR